ncbi:MAG: hypothetical protein ACK2T3_03600, partial [Candidatus Promineifilaceae bacterium]
CHGSRSRNWLLSMAQKLVFQYDLDCLPIECGKQTTTSSSRLTDQSAGQQGRDPKRHFRYTTTVL